MSEKLRNLPEGTEQGKSFEWKIKNKRTKKIFFMEVKFIQT